MKEAQVRTGGNDATGGDASRGRNLPVGAILHDAALDVRPDAAWFDPAHWSRQGRATAVGGGRGGVQFVDTPVGAAVLRHYRRGGLMRNFSADRYLWTGADNTRAFREFRLLSALLKAGLPVPVPIAARYVRHGFRYTADLLTRLIVDTNTLAERLQSGNLNTATAQAIGVTVASFHAAGAWHADLNAHNILIDRQAGIWVIDFDRGRLLRPAPAWQASNLARLRRSLEKLGATRQPDFDARVWHPLLAAYHSELSQHEVELLP